MNAVITADIVDYTRLDKNEETLVLNKLHLMFKEVKAIRVNINKDFSIRRGDNIQGELDNAADALQIALLLKAAVNEIKLNNNSPGSPEVDIRIAIGIGNIETKRELVGESSGEAYTFSGRTLDSMKRNKRLLAIKTPDEIINAEFETECKLMEVIMAGWKTTSAEVLYLTLQNQNETQIAEKLKISQSAVNQRKKTAGWSGIEAMLSRYSQLMSKEVAS